MTFLDSIWLFAFPLVLVPILIRRHRTSDCGVKRISSFAMVQLCSRRMPSLVLPFVLAAFLVSTHFVSSTAVAQDEAAEKAKPEMPDVEMLECRVKVVDPDGFPVEGATVYSTGVRSKENPGAHYLMDWLMKLRVQTDKEGIAKMPYPKMVGKETTGTITWSVEHPDFISYRADHSVGDDPAEIEMERGFRIALTAKRLSGEKITEHLYAAGNFGGVEEWELKKNGTLVSNAMKKQQGVLRVVCFEPGKPTLFSKEIEVKPGDKGRILIQGIELSTGCRIEGKLAESVERPIKNGYVIACVSKKSRPTDRHASWHWTDEAKIEPDGSFVFESLPRDEVVQMLPICDGWVPAKPKPEEVLALLPNVTDPDKLANRIDHFEATPQLIKTKGDSISTTLYMVKGPTLTIEIVDQTGKSLEGVALGTSPNQFWFNSGSQFLGTSMSSRERWERLNRGEDLRAFSPMTTPYQKKTGKPGLAVFKSMPPGTHDFYVGMKGWELAEESETGEKTSIRVTIEGEDVKLKIKMKPKQDSDSNTDIEAAK